MTAILTAPCRGCHRVVSVDRVGRQIRVMEPVGRTQRLHRCRRPSSGPRLRGTDRCGVWMPIAGEPCARYVGHADSHRSRYDLDNQIAARRSGLAA